MIVWRNVPWSLWIFAVLNVPGAVLIEIEVSGQILSKALFPLFVGAWLFFLLKGVRWVWLGSLGIFVLGFVADLASGSLSWHSFALGLIAPALLLLPATRRYFARINSAPSAP